jgi:hypothetical protein
MRLVTITSSKALQEPLPTVHLTVALVPTATPVIVVVGELAVVMVALPLTNVHVPEPLCVIVKLDVLHKVWFAWSLGVSMLLTVSRTALDVILLHELFTITLY